MMQPKSTLRRGLLGAALAVTSLALAAPATAGNRPLWVRQLGTDGYEEATGVATDAAGDVYVAGWTSGAVSGPNHGNSDAWVAKTDAGGRLLWRRQLGSERGEKANGIATDAGGNVYLAGQTFGSLAGPNGNSSPYCNYDYYESYCLDAWMAKYDAAGHLLWKRQLGTDQEDVATGVATDAAGHVYVVGWTGAKLAGPNKGGWDAWVAKYDTTGHLLWKRQPGTADYDSARGVATDAAGNVYLTGVTLGSLGSASRGSSDAWVAKYDGAGNPLWERQLGTAENDRAYGVATDAAGNVYLTGYTEGSLGGPLVGDLDAWVAKYNAAGDELWIRQLGTLISDYAYGVATDTAGNVYISGETEGSLGRPNPPPYDPDAWVAKYDAAGNEVWVRQFGTPNFDKAYGVATDASGNVYLAGSTEGSLCGTNRGGSDAFVAKYSTQP